MASRVRAALTGQRHCTPVGVLGSQASHTRALGSHAEFGAANPQFDEGWRQRVTASVSEYRAQVQGQQHPVAADGLDAPLTSGEILVAMRSLKNGTAPSPATGIPNELLKYGGAPMANMLEALFNAIWASGQPPAAWLQGTIRYFHKSGATDDMSNYRGITLLDVVGKLFHKVLANRLLRHAEERGLLSTAQNAFRRGRSCDEHIFCISQAVQGRQRMAKPTYAFFLDLRKAYDTVWRDGLLYKLWNMGIRGKVWQYVDALYARSERVVSVGGLTSDRILIDLGLAQGDTLSCILFNLFVNDLH